jgi:hypothetical protein
VKTSVSEVEAFPVSDCDENQRSAEPEPVNGFGVTDHAEPLSTVITVGVPEEARGSGVFSLAPP